MAHQFHVVHSSQIKGAGIVAGGPYACAGSGFPSNLIRVFNRCMNLPDIIPFLGPPDVADSLAATREAAATGAIDDPANLAGSRLYLFSGGADVLVPHAVVDVVARYYAAVGAGDIIFQTTIPAAHAMVTADFGNPCETSHTPFINDCDYDLAGAILQQIYGPRRLAPPGEATGELRSFDQRPFIPAGRDSGLADEGYLYLPPSCAEGARCRLHIAFHGCNQDAAAIGDAFVRHAGYNRWADANAIVVLYPQMRPTTRTLAGVSLPWPNPQACWDWWGFTGADYALRSAPQITAVAAMIERLAGARRAPAGR